MEEERSFHTFSIRFPLIFQDHFSEWQLECEFSSLSGEMEWQLCVCLLEFLPPLGKRLHWLLNLMSPHFETELYLLWEEVEARPQFLKSFMSSTISYWLQVILTFSYLCLPGQPLFLASIQAHLLPHSVIIPWTFLFSPLNPISDVCLCVPCTP